MDQVVEIVPPLTDAVLAELRAGQMVHLSGIVYTARDAAHLRMTAALREGRELPFPIQGQVLYYTGPCPAPPGRIIGSAGPTTSGRMDTMTVPLLEAGLKGMIGKGERSSAVITGMQRYGAVYFAAVGGAGALLSRCIQEVEVIAYPDLGTEAVHRLTVNSFPVVVAIDSQGGSVYSRRKQYELTEEGEINSGSTS